MAEKKDVSVDLSEFRRKKKPGCGFANLDLKPEHLEVLKAAMQADDISNRGILEWMTQRGYEVGKEALANHRAGRCVCP
jgi:hypothetical protein